jgi:predicted alpha/beta hydrolase
MPAHVVGKAEPPVEAVPSDPMEGANDMKAHSRPRGTEPTTPPDAEAGRLSTRRGRRLAAVAAVVLGMVTATATALSGSASAAVASTQRGPDPTVQSVAANRGTFTTAEITVPTGFGFNGGKIYYPTDTSQGTWGAIAAVPGYTATWAKEGAWMGPWLASFGFVVIGIDTNSPTDFDTARGTQLLAALDYLTGRSAVRDRVDPNRLAVLGHSMGGGGAISAAMRRPSLKAAIPLAPASFSQNLSNVRVPTLMMGARDDGTVTPSSLDNLWASKPATTKGARVELTSGGHGFPTWGNSQVTRREIPWLKIFLDDDSRYAKFLCPSLADTTGVSRYVSECPYGSTTPPTTPPTTPTSTPPTSTPPTGACSAGYRTVNSWAGGYQGEVTVTAGSSAINGWSVRWTLDNGETINQVWNGTVSTSGSSVTVRNVSYNSSLQPSASITFGFLANGTPSAPTLTCTSP